MPAQPPTRDPSLEEVISIEIDPKLAQNKMITENNHVFKDRRIDLVGSLLTKN